MQRYTRFLPLIVLAIGIGFRWYAVDWALPHTFHPDETRLLYAMNDLAFKDGDFNPNFFAYGSLPIYLLKLTYETAKIISPTINFFLVGRSLSALWGSLTLVMLYLFGRRFFSERAALLSTTFLALTVLHIQLSHFLTVDVFLTFLIVSAMYAMAALANGSTPFRHYALSGVTIGLAMATKVSALPLYGVLLGAHVLLFMRVRWNRASFQTLPPRSIFRRTRHTAFWLWGMFGAALVISGLVFVICQPYAILDFHEFSRQITEQSDMVRGVTQPPYTIQYEDTPAYLYPLEQFIRYSAGIPLGLLVLTATLVLTVNTIISLLTLPRRIATFPKTVALLLVWVLPVFGIVGGFQVKFLRYMLPLIPFFCLLGAVWIDQLLQRFAAWKMLIWAGVLAVIGYSSFYALTFLSIYAHDDPREQMSDWIYAHVQPGASVLTEQWEFVSLVPRDGQYPGQYHTEGLDLYGPDTEPKIRTLARQLSEADAIILATKRLYGSILRVPQRYPLTTRYYQQLFDGTLGFGTVETFVNYPALCGVEFNDDFADESFSVYDHPKTVVFQKTAALSAEQLYQRLTATPPVDAERLLSRLLAFPAQEHSGTAEDVIPDRDQQTEPPVRPIGIGPMAGETPTSLSAVVFWFVTIEILALIALPYSLLLFRYLPDCGYSVAKAFGLLLPGYGVWLLVSLNLLTFRRGMILGVAGGVLGLGMLLVVRYWPYYAEQCQRKWRVFLAQEGVFAAVFGGFLLFRAYNPDIFWSESSMDFSFLNVLVRTDSFPPPDPWFSGAPLNYYYFGHYLVALLTKLTGIPAHVSYNLAFACIPAIVAAEVFSVLYNLTRRYVWGWIGVLFAMVLGNLDGFFLLLATWRVRAPLLDAIFGKIAWLDALIGTEHYYRIFRPAHEVIQYTVHEFPFWTFLFVDLHAHLLNMPFLVALFLMGLNVLSADRHPTDLASSTGVSILSILLLTLLLGTVGVISSWDYPTTIIFLGLCMIFRLMRAYWSARETVGAAWRQLLLLAGVIVPGSLLLYRPFYAEFSRSGMGLALVGQQTTTFSAFFTFFGFFLWLIVGYLVLRVAQSHRSPGAWVVSGLMLISATVLWFVGTFLFQRDYATLLFALTIGALTLYLIFKHHLAPAQTWKPVPSEVYVKLCILYASLIVAGCELVFVRDFLQGGEYKRMNTIFKFYLPAWYLLAFAAAYAVYALWQHLKQQSRGGHAGIRIVLGGALLLFGMAAVFPVVSSYSRRQSDFYARHKLAPTLNGLAFLNATNADEYQAILWLNQHVTGTPTILEAVHDDYRYEYARISANTGLPTVLGWPSHADQREHWGQTQQRRQDVTDIYTTRDIQQAYALLQKYQVRYIYIGQTEREDFPSTGLQKFESFPEHFHAVFRSGETVTYEVNLTN